jgi:hypothetical protein
VYTPYVYACPTRLCRRSGAVFFWEERQEVWQFISSKGHRKKAHPADKNALVYKIAHFSAITWCAFHLANTATIFNMFQLHFPTKNG